MTDDQKTKSLNDEAEQPQDISSEKSENHENTQLEVSEDCSKERMPVKDHAETSSDEISTPCPKTSEEENRSEIDMTPQDSNQSGFGYGTGTMPQKGTCGNGAEPQNPSQSGFGYGTGTMPQKGVYGNGAEMQDPSQSGFGYGTGTMPQKGTYGTGKVPQNPSQSGFGYGTGTMPQKGTYGNAAEPQNSSQSGFGYGQENGAGGNPPPPGGFYAPPGAPMPRGPRPKMSTQTKVILGVFIVLAVIFLAVGIGVSIFYTLNHTDSGVVQNPSSSESGEKDPSSNSSEFETPEHPYIEDGETSNTKITLASKTGSPMDATEIFQKVSPSVVGVVAEVSDGSGNTGTSQGTGIIASSDGVILTNSHVINNSKKTKVKVILQDNSEYEASVKGYDKTSDLALLKISAQNLPAAVFGNADEMQVGEKAYAIGNPGGIQYAYSMTDGIISALHRPITSHSENGITYIQTNVAINPGNSGGPLINDYGQVVGITSNKIMASGVEGMGFAIPINQTADIINQLISNGYVNGRGRLGITVKNLSGWEQNAYDINGGVYIYSINDGSPLKDTKANAGDILLQIDGEQIDSVSDMTNIMGKYHAGDSVTLTVFSVNQGENFDVQVTLLEDKSDN
ncbi:MAG: trypsin-like peptidase domain-containing protein [Oscillospiraceae bacterium]|jgi:serine protease Do|nr:trypsin-like peptidase domain-containing protein [Oscillospiraceae bacterium]MCI2191097.1 trypsin-like peptidase domain-containing protein [Oscillospiraceae bacterium]